jgi:hypothetical protein
LIVGGIASTSIVLMEYRQLEVMGLLFRSL